MNYLNTVFILGYPRSGTTWFANLFNSHPDVAYRHEVIGRCYQHFPEELFHKLKHNNGLTDEEYEKVINIILSPNVESDRAPFFHKNHLKFKSAKFHYIFWLACRALKVLNPLYNFLFFPKKEGLTLVVKETRSTVNMDSMLKGIRADKIIILFRHPCGAIASSLTGIETGKMSKSTNSMRDCWFNENKHKPYIKALNFSTSDIHSLPEHEYLAILWRQQNDDYLEFSSAKYKKIFINYENFMINQEEKTKDLFKQLSINYDAIVEQFMKITSGKGSSKPILKDSSSEFYSVYRNGQFDPDKWKQSLSQEQLAHIEKHTLDTFNELLERSNQQ